MYNQFFLSVSANHLLKVIISHNRKHMQLFILIMHAKSVTLGDPRVQRLEPMNLFRSYILLHRHNLISKSRKTRNQPLGLIT